MLVYALWLLSANSLSSNLMLASMFRLLRVCSRSDMCYHLSSTAAAVDLPLLLRPDDRDESASRALAVFDG